MAGEPKPRLTLIDRAMAADGVDLSQAPKTRELLTKHAPSIAKQVRKEVLAEVHEALGVRTLEEASQVAGIKAERDARPTLNEELKHGRHQFWRGGVICGSFGILLGAGLVYAAFAWSQQASFQSAADYGTRMVVSGAALQSGNPPSTCIPGETLEDGRRCPMTTDQRVAP